MLGLRKINKDGKHYDFVWPLEVGDKAVAPDWNPNEACGGGLHVFPEGIGQLGLLNGYYWAVVEYDETKAVDLDGKVKVPECTIVHLSKSSKGLLKYFPKMKNPTSQQAYLWAKFIGDREYMRQFITESEHAYLWARFIGDVECMRQFINSAHDAYYWACNIGDREYMRQFITDPYYAYDWARDIGDREYMRQFITDPYHAHLWAHNIGDREYMLEVARGTEYESMILKLNNCVYY